MYKTGFVWDEQYMWHDTGSHAGIMPPGKSVQPGVHFENPETKRRFKNLLEVSGLYKKLILIEPRYATEKELLRVHTYEYVKEIKRLSDSTGGDAGLYTPFGPGSYEIAKLSAGGVITAVDSVLSGEVDNVYALVRPPGHHAKADQGIGFCIFANAAIAGLHALEAHHLDRVAYVDWDVHHGNGTEQIFWSDSRALTISIHQDRSFPHDTGFIEDIGEGEGKGYNINIPLPAGSGVGAYKAAFDRVVIPALRAFNPDLIIVPSGFDAGAHDPLGRNQMDSNGYRSLTKKLMGIAEKTCSGRIVMCHEGGYDPNTAPFYGLAVMEALSDIKTDIEDPFQPIFEAFPGQKMQPHEHQVIRRVEAILAAAPFVA